MSVDTIAQWVSTVIPPTIPVIISHQNAPKPSGDFIVVSFVSSEGSCYPIVDVEASNADPLAVFTADNDTLLSVDLTAFSSNGADLLNDIKNRASLPPYQNRPIMADCGTIRGPAFFNDSGFSPQFTCEYQFREGHVTQDLDPRVQRIVIVGYMDGIPITIEQDLATPDAPPLTEPVVYVMTNGGIVIDSEGNALTAE